MKYLLISISVLFAVSCTEERKADEESHSQERVEELRIVFLSSRNNNYDLYIIDINGTQEQRLTTNPEFDWGPTYDKASERISYNSMVNERYVFSQINTDGTGQDSLGFQNGGSYLTSPDRQLILYEQQVDDENNEIFIAEKNGANEVNISNSDSYDGRARWSRKGDRIAFISERDADGDGELFVINRDGSDLKQLTFNQAREKYLTWSNDDLEIAVVSYRDNEAGEIYLINMETGEERRLTDNDTPEEEIVWSPVDRRIAFHGRDKQGNDEIMILDIDTGTITEVTDNEYYDGEPEWVY